jgi:glutamate/tyrosine decarboxylase-like PLP-dependent enzyme
MDTAPFEPDVDTIAAASSCDDGTVLFPCDLRRLDIDDGLTRLLARARVEKRNGGVAATIGPEEAEASLAAFDFQDPADLADVLAWVIGEMGRGITQIGHPRYFGLFNPTPAFPSECADRIVASFNAQLASATTSPFPVAVERHVLGAIASRLGMPAHTAGHFTSGGSEANAASVLCALTTAEPRYAQDGVSAFKAAPRIYVSWDAHMAWVKIAHQAGIGRAAIRLIATDGQGRLDPAELIRCMREDDARGDLPLLVVSTAGTTGAGMIDCLDANADIAQQFGAWHHVDAAWGGGAVASDKLIGVLHGIERAHSVTIDAHKWLATTMGCGMFLTQRPDALAKTFHATMECMPSCSLGRDPYVTTAQWSRRFLGLRLFVGLAAGGWQAYAALVEKSVELAALLRARLENTGWRVVNRSSLAVLCLRPPEGAPDARRIAASVVHSGQAWVSSVTFLGESVVRVCLTSGETRAEDVMHLADLLDSFVHARSPDDKGKSWGGCAIPPKPPVCL